VLVFQDKDKTYYVTDRSDTDSHLNKEPLKKASAVKKFLDGLS